MADPNSGESLGSEDFAWLRKQLVDLGPFLDPVRTAPPSEQLPDFPDTHDAAVVALEPCAEVALFA